MSCVDSVGIRRIASLASLTLALALASAGAAGATTWHDGDLLTYGQAQWGDDPDPMNLLSTNYSTIYGPFDTFQIGSPVGFTITFDAATTLLDYLPSIGAAGPLESNLSNPTSSASGSLGGDVAAVKLDVDFSDAGLLPGSAGLQFGDLILHDLTATPDYNNLTVREALAALNSALGGLPTADNCTDLDALALEISAAFVDGSPIQFAQDHLSAPVPEPGTALLLGSGVAGLVLFGRSKRG